MDHRGLLLLTLLSCVYTVNVYAEFEPVCIGQKLEDDYNGFLVYLDLGYNNPKPRASVDMAITVNQIKTNTRCAIQTVCLSIMQLAGLKGLSPYKFYPFKDIPRDVLVILYNMDTGYDHRVIYPLWQLFLYVTHIQIYVTKLNFSQMKLVHEMITQQLSSMMDGCPGDNDFSMTDSRLKEHDIFSDKIKKHFDQLRPELKRVTKENGSYKRIDANNLLGGYMNSSKDKYNFNEVLIEFRKGSEWGDLPHVFLKAYHKATDPSNLYDGCQGISEFQSLWLTLLKMVMLRMICIHLLLVTDENRLELNAAMDKTVTSFTINTGLINDQTFVETFRMLRAECPSPEASTEVIELIRADLATSSSSFEGCKVSTISKEDIPKIFCDVDNLKKFPTDEYKNIGLAEMFVEKVGEWLVKQEFIKSVLALSYPIPGNFPKDNLPPFLRQ